MSDSAKYYIFMDGNDIMGVGEAPNELVAAELMGIVPQLQGWEVPKAVYELVESFLDEIAEVTGEPPETVQKLHYNVSEDSEDFLPFVHNGEMKSMHLPRPPKLPDGLMVTDAETFHRMEELIREQAEEKAQKDRAEDDEEWESYLKHAGKIQHKAIFDPRTIRGVVNEINVIGSPLQIPAHLREKQAEAERRERDALARLLHNHGPVPKGGKPDVHNQ